MDFVLSGQINRGIYDDFHGYRLPTEDELNSALQSALVVLDANALLNLYRYNESTRKRSSWRDPESG